MKMKKRAVMMAMPYLNMVDNMAHVYLTTEDDDCSAPPPTEEHHVGVDHAEEAACEGVSCRNSPWKKADIFLQKASQRPSEMLVVGCVNSFPHLGRRVKYPFL